MDKKLKIERKMHSRMRVHLFCMEGTYTIGGKCDLLMRKNYILTQFFRVYLF